MELDTVIAALIEQIKECNYWLKVAYHDGSAQPMLTNENRRLAYLVSIGTIILVHDGETVDTASAIHQATTYFKLKGMNWHTIV